MASSSTTNMMDASADIVGLSKIEFRVPVEKVAGLLHE
jgi:hypothetical protein